jgi:hypothetical protein
MCDYIFLTKKRTYIRGKEVVILSHQEREITVAELISVLKDVDPNSKVLFYGTIISENSFVSVKAPVVSAHISDEKYDNVQGVVKLLGVQE